jgi:hypothetical protein
LGGFIPLSFETVAFVADDEVEACAGELWEEFGEFFIVCEEDLVGSV